MAKTDTDTMLDTLRAKIPEARKAFPTDPAIREIAETFQALDAALSNDEELPTDWCGDDEVGVDPDDDLEDEPDDDLDEDDEMSDAEAAEEMRRVAGG